MFSSRTNWNTAANQLTQLLQKKRLHGEVIFDLTESNPTQCGFSYPDQEILTAIADQSALLYKPEPRGLLSARTVIAEYYESFDIAVDPQRVILTASTSEAYTFLLRLLCNVGDEVVVPQPSYPLFEYLCQLNDVTLRYYRLAYDGEWHVDFKSLQAELTSRTRAIVVVHPNNPTGSYLKQDEFDRIGRLAVKYNCSLIADEVFAPFAFRSDSRRTCILASHFPRLVFSLNGISKLLGLPQLKLSWIVVNGQTEQVNEALNRLDIITDTFLSVNTPIQVALPKLIRHQKNIVGQIRTRILTNYGLLQKVFAGSAISIFHNEGGWYSILQLPKKKSDDDWTFEVLANQQVLVYPGHFFNFEQESCVIISLLVMSELLEDALWRIRRLVEKKV